MTRLLPLLLLCSGCALLRSPATQQTPTSANGARTVVIVFALFGSPHVVGLDQSGAVGGSSGAQKAEQRTDVKADAKVSGLPGLP